MARLHRGIGLHGLAIVVLAAACQAGAAAAGEPLTGRWAVRIVQSSTGCDWTGEVRLNEKDGTLTGDGSATASKDSRDPRRCPPLKGEVNGTVRGDVVRFGFATGRLGKAEFEGKLVAKSKQMHGLWSARSAAGQWAAAR
jgi:hypothetical protein